ncbi:tetratricopeptide repeat protein [Patescibacteria group bacterium]
MFDKIIKYSLYSLAFLVPVFFLPLTVFPVAQNKQMLLSVFVLLLLIFWIIKIISSGRLTFVWNKLCLAVSLLLLVLGVSTALSSSRVQSFWGMSVEPDTLFNFILFALVFFLFVNLIEKKEEILKVITSFLFGSGILSLLFLIQILKPILPWDFAKVAGFNPVGSIQGLAVFLGGAFVALIALIVSDQLSVISIKGKTISKKTIQVLSGVLGFLLFIVIFLVNFWAVWLGIAFGLAIIIFSRLKNLSVADKVNPVKPLLLPLFVFVLALVFIFTKMPVSNIVALPSEISPTYKATIDVSIETLKDSPKNLILGSGPATFGYQYGLHRGTGQNLTNFWQIRFSQGAAALPTFLATFGILGILSILLMMAVFFWQGFKSLIFENVKSLQYGVVVLASGFYFLIIWFFYSVNLSLLFTAFLMMALWTACNKKTKEFSFTQSPQKAFFVMLLGVVLIAGSIFGFYVVFQKQAGAISFVKGLSLINVETPELDKGIQNLNKAANLDQKDVYFRNLSQIFLLKIDEVLNNQELSQEEKQKEFQQIVSSAELSATAAVQVNSANSQNWLQLGNIYENLALVNIEGAEELAILNYQKTAELDPQNPQIPLNLGRVYKSIAERIKFQITLLEQTEEEDRETIEKLKESSDKNLELALEEFKKSAELKINFSAAYYLTAQVYEIQGETEEALQGYQIVLELEPENEEVKAKIEELTK